MSKKMQDILASARPVERSVTICVAGDLNAKIDDAERRLSGMQQKATLGRTDEEREVAEEIERLREQMREHEVTFTFRALSSKKWSDLMAAHPGRAGKDEGFNVESMPTALIAASCMEPEMTVDEAESLADVLNNAQFGALFDCAWSCSNRDLDIPFSVLASRVLRDSSSS